MQTRKPLFIPLESKRTFEEIADQIRELIYSGTLKPGDRLPSERELAAKFKTGRMVLREALRTLEQSGLIYIKHGSIGGAFIKEIDSTVIKGSISDMLRVGNITPQDLTELRLGIESAILKLAIERRNNDDLILLEKNIEDTEREILKGAKAYECNLNFHVLLAKISKNRLYEIIIESLMSAAKPLIISKKPEAGYSDKVLKYHKEIYQAVKDRNLPMAEDKLHDHFYDIEERYLKGTKSRVKQASSKTVR